MQTLVGLKEFRNNVAAYTKRIRSGESFLILKRSQPLFKVTPITDVENNWEEVIDFTKIKKGGVKIQELLSRL